MTRPITSSCPPGSMVPMSSSHAPAAIMAMAMSCTARRSMNSARLIQHHRGAVGDDFAHGLADFRGVKTHHHHRVGLHEARILDHAIDCLAAGELEQLGVFLDLTAHDRAQAGENVAAEAAAADDDPEDLTLDFPHALSGNVFGRPD